MMSASMTRTPKEKEKEKRLHERVACETPLEFVALSMQESEFRRTHASATVINTSKAGMGILTEFRLEPGHVLVWDDSHKRGALHVAMVKWAQKEGELCRGGLMLL
jgi:hypothetical protein